MAISSTSSTFRLCLVSIIALGFLATLPFTHSQSASIVSNAGFFRYGSKFYIVGGGVVREKTVGVFGFTVPEYLPGSGQFANLDLSNPLDTSKATWNMLSSGPKTNGVSAAISSDGKRVVAFEPGNQANFVSLYDVEKDTWSPINLTVPAYTRTGIFPIADPTSNKVYMAGGYSEKQDQISIFDFMTNNITNIPMASGMNGILNYRAAWWSTKGCIVYFGGSTDGGWTSSPDTNVAPNVLNMYCPGTNSWSTLTTTGEAPNRRTDICMAISDDGNTLVIYGGRYYPSFHDQVVSDDIFKLDLNTMVWVTTKIDSKPRMYAACTIYNDQFILWGGTDAAITVSDPFIVIKTSDITSKKAAKKKAALIGGICGGVAFIVIIGLCYRFCCRAGNPIHRQSNNNIKLTYNEANRIIIDSKTQIIKPVRLGRTNTPVVTSSTPSTLPSAAQPTLSQEQPTSPASAYRAYPKLDSRNRNSYSVLASQEAVSNPVLTPPEESIYPMPRSQEANSYPVLNPRSPAYHPSQHQIEMENTTFGQLSGVARSPQVTSAEDGVEVSGRSTRGPEAY